MDVIFSLYEKLEEYFDSNSDFIKSVTNNWIDSNIDDRFSCELLQPTTQKKYIGEKNLPQYVSNGHLIYKWHLHVNNFWNLDSLKFIVTKINESQNYTIKNHKNIIYLNE
jgi:hypothetical protein